MTYRIEFPDFPLADMPIVPASFVDTSWHNDVCPSFHNATARLTLWVDYADPAKREFQGEGRFSLTRTDADGATLEGIGRATDDWSEILQDIEAELRSVATSAPHFDTEKGEDIDPVACHQLLDMADEVERMRAAL